MQPIRFYLFIFVFSLIGSLYACPACTGKVDSDSPAFFEHELYEPSYRHSKPTEGYAMQTYALQTDMGYEDGEILSEEEYGDDED